MEARREISHTLAGPACCGWDSRGPTYYTPGFSFYGGAPRNLAHAWPVQGAAAGTAGSDAAKLTRFKAPLYFQHLIAHFSGT